MKDFVTCKSKKNEFKGSHDDTMKMKKLKVLDFDNPSYKPL
jgi:hypothetical protein